MSQFGGGPLIAGTLTGIRAFSLRADGKLAAVTGHPGPRGHPYVYAEGENVAHCHWSHRPGTGYCGCGFYAYFPRAIARSHGNPMTVSGMVEGYGVVTAGTRGFRAEKLRILCLINPLGAQLLLLFGLVGMPGLGITLITVVGGWLGGLGGCFPVVGLLSAFLFASQGVLVSRSDFARVRKNYPNTPVHFRWYATLRYRGEKPPEVVDD